MKSDRREASGKPKHARESFRDRLPWIVATLVIAGGLAIFISKLDPAGDGAAHVRVTVPELSRVAQRGSEVFAAHCALCHGSNAAGSDKGPPLVHDIYNPGHHADAAFTFAVRQGVRQHHWRYGNMPPQRQVSDADVAAIVRYIRELQKANGIKYRAHRM